MIIYFFIFQGKTTRYSNINSDSDEEAVSNNNNNNLQANPFIVAEFYQYSSAGLNAFLKGHNGRLPCCTKHNSPRQSSVTQRMNEAIRQYHANNQMRKSSIESDAFLSNDNSNNAKHGISSSGNELIAEANRILNEKSNEQSSSVLVETTANNQKQFFYYVDPRISNNFISIFNSLKRKSLNKDFQF